MNQSQGLTVTSQIKIVDAKNSDISNAIKYVILLLGTPKEKMPTSLEMVLMQNYLRLYMKDILIDEIQIAFDLAVQKKFPVNLDLYGGTLSIKFVSDVLNAYLTYKKALLKPTKEEPMVNIDRAAAVFEIIKKNDPEALEKLKEIGSTEKKYEPAPFPYHDIHQRWLRQFDKLKMKYVVEHTGDRFIQRYGEVMDITRYFSKKAEQLQMAKERNADKL